MIKKFILLASWMILLFTVADAQINNPVKWLFTAKKVTDKTYELYITANLESNWHIYAQDSNESTGTSFSFSPNPLVKFDGKVKESGKMEKTYDPNVKSVLRYYSNQVDFIQKIKVRSTATTLVKGTVTYIVCNDKKCLPPNEVPFSIKLAGK